jgi:hypothetical protein
MDYIHPNRTNDYPVLFCYIIQLLPHNFSHNAMTTISKGVFDIQSVIFSPI